MKRITILVLAMVMVLSLLTACGSNNKEILASKKFISAAESADYTMIIEEDYDGYGTYWAGAFKFAEGVEKEEDNEIYKIDYTKDQSVYNAEVEYENYIDEVKEIGGKQNSGSGKNYSFHVNSSSTEFGIAFRVEEVNLFVVAPAEYKDEILKFFKDIGYEVKI